MLNERRGKTHFQINCFFFFNFCSLFLIICSRFFFYLVISFSIQTLLVYHSFFIDGNCISYRCYCCFFSFVCLFPYILSVETILFPPSQSCDFDFDAHCRSLFSLISVAVWLGCFWWSICVQQNTIHTHTHRLRYCLTNYLLYLPTALASSSSCSALIFVYMPADHIFMTYLYLCVQFNFW